MVIKQNNFYSSMFIFLFSTPGLGLLEDDL